MKFKVTNSISNGFVRNLKGDGYGITVLKPLQNVGFVDLALPGLAFVLDGGRDEPRPREPESEPAPLYIYQFEVIGQLL